MPPTMPRFIAPWTLPKARPVAPVTCNVPVRRATDMPTPREHTPVLLAWYVVSVAGKVTQARDATHAVTLAGKCGGSYIQARSADLALILSRTLARLATPRTPIMGPPSAHVGMVR